MLVDFLFFLLDPRFELPDRFSLHRKLDVGVDGVGVFTARMAHQCLADFLQYPCLHEPRVERVSKIMEAVVADARAANGGLPGGFHDADGLIFEREEQPGWLC